VESEESDPDKRNPEGPVGWLLGPQLIASLKWMLLYAAFGTKLEARDWMQAQPYPSGSKVEAENAWRDSNKPNLRDQLRERAGGWKFPVEASKDFWEQKGEFWFDYIADTGDGQKATYSVAYLCLNTLWAKRLWEAKPHRDAGGPLDYPDRNSDLMLDCRVNPEETELVPLPRGEFLFVGGDTTYHMADYASLHPRFQTPFTWAFEDFKKDMKGVQRSFEAGWFASHEWWALKNKGSISPLVQSYEWRIALIPATLAGLVGALMSCVWFGWYLSISLAFNGHNNEAGGAA
jgi:hypothetical protein